MEINRDSRRILLKELRTEGTPYTDMYGMRLFPLNSIKTILDLGANIGFYSVPFRFFQPNARIVAIEPDKSNFNMLTENTQNLDIEVYNLALGNGKEVSKNKGKFSVTHKFSPDASGNEKCQSLLLNDIVEKYKIDLKGLFIKIDTEGAERFIFNHNPSEDIIRKSIGTSMEVHNRLYGIFDVASTIKWSQDRFSSTHNIYSYSRNRTAVHISFISKEIKL
jgi:FkbM family methyltransferase